METQPPTDNASPAAKAVPPIVFLHEASPAVYRTARNGFNNWTHSEVGVFAHTIALLERSRENVPAFVEPEAEEWLRQRAKDVLVPGQFKTLSRAMKNDIGVQPKGVRTLGGLFTIDGGDSKVASAQLLRMAERCTGVDEKTNLKVLTTRIERAIHAELKAVS